MSDIGLRSKMFVKDVMSSPVITVSKDASAKDVAELMEKHDLGCIIVTDKNAKPLGIITERDLVIRVISKNLRPDAVRSEEVMTSPLISIDPEATINEAARRMSRLNIRRLVVIYRGLLVGLLSSKDVLAVMPELLETIQERTLIEAASRVDEEEEEAPIAGHCDRCGRWSEDLVEIEGEDLCEDCRAEETATEE